MNRKNFTASNFLLVTIMVIIIVTAVREITTVAQVGKIRPKISLSSLDIGEPELEDD